MSRILVTGGTGFVGQSLVTALLAKGHCVTLLTRQAADGISKRFPQQVGFVRGDLTRPQTLTGICSGFDVVFHLAGDAHANIGGRHDDARHHRVTVEGTRTLLMEAQTKQVEKFIFFSSVKAGGEGGQDVITEASSGLPDSGYGRARLAAEALVLEAGKNSGFHVTNLRLAMVYGAGCKGNLARMISGIDHGQFPPLPETSNKRSLVHVSDVVKAALLVCEHPAANGKTYIVTDNESYSTRRIYEAICRALGRDIPNWTVPLWSLRVGALLADAINFIAPKQIPFGSDALRKLIGSGFYSSQKITAELGYRPDWTLESALPDMIRRYREIF